MTEDDLIRVQDRFYTYTNVFVEKAADPYPYILKQEHTMRVCDNIRMLSRSLNLSSNTMCLAVAAAMVHDMGRFPQFDTFGTFADGRSKNHGSLGAKVLVRHDILKGIPKTEKQLILRALVLHNRPRLPLGLESDLDLIARLLRDADKIDIYGVMKDHYQRVESGNGFITHDLTDDGKVSHDLVMHLLNKQRLDFNRVITLNDMKVFQIGMVFDLNFPATAKAVKDLGIIPAIVFSMPADSLLDELSRTIESYLMTLSADLADN